MQTNDTEAEQVRFGRALDNALAAAHWQKTQNVLVKSAGAAEFRETPQRLYERVSDRGVVVYGPEDDMRAAVALRDELNRGLMQTELASASDIRGAVLLVIGPR